MIHPFWFYGAHPAEWYDGGRFDYEIQFEAAAGASERAAMAAAIKAAVPEYHAIVLDPYDAWSWADRWAKATVRARSARVDYGGLFAEVDALFRVMHRVWPIAAVVCRSVEPTPELPDDEWTAASLAAAPDLGPRPRWSDGPRRALDRFAPHAWLDSEVLVDREFEDARVPPEIDEE